MINPSALIGKIGGKIQVTMVTVLVAIVTLLIVRFGIWTGLIGAVHAIITTPSFLGFVGHVLLMMVSIFPITMGLWFCIVAIVWLIVGDPKQQ